MSLSDTTPCNEESHTELIGRVSEHLSSRRSFLTNTATIGGGALTLSAFGSGTAAASGTEGGSGSDGDDGDEEVSDIDVLDFALTLEHLEAAYYNEFLDEYSEHDVERSDVAAIFVNDSLRYSTYQFIQAIRTTRRPTSRRSHGPSMTSVARPSKQASTSSPTTRSRSSPSSPLRSKPSVSPRTPARPR